MIRRLATWGRTGLGAAVLGLRLASRVATMRGRVVPTFFVLGPPRSGTTSLDHYLRQHPSYRPPLLKEVGYNYAERRRPHFELLGGLLGGLPSPVLRPVAGALQGLFYVGGDDGYRKVFPRAREMERVRRRTGGAATADSTVFGLYERDTADAFPFSAGGEACRFITILRSPADFLYSFYTKEIGRAYYPVDRSVSFETFLREPSRLYTDRHAVEIVEQRLEEWRPTFEERAFFDPSTFNFATAMVCYSVYVKRWADRVGDRLLVLSFADLRDRTQETVDRVIDFLGLPPHRIADTEAQNVGRYRGRELPAEGAALVREVAEPYTEELYDFLGRDLGW